MPLIKIELDDSTKCDGCPCNHWEGPCDDEICLMNYWDHLNVKKVKKGGSIIRPQACIDLHDHTYKKVVEEVLEQFARYTTNCSGCRKECPDCETVIDCGELNLICREKLIQSADELEG